MLVFAETYRPMLVHHTHSEQGPFGNSGMLGSASMNTKSVKQLVTVVLTRPIRMFAEPLVLFTCLFLALEYAMFFLYFEAYPIIFKGTLSRRTFELELIPPH